MEVIKKNLLILEVVFFASLAFSVNIIIFELVIP